jgi:hypothetical protein
VAHLRYRSLVLLVSGPRVLVVLVTREEDEHVYDEERTLYKACDQSNERARVRVTYYLPQRTVESGPLRTLVWFRPSGLMMKMPPRDDANAIMRQSGENVGSWLMP